MLTGVFEVSGPSYTREGMEMTYGVNVAAPFLLTSLLINSTAERVVSGRGRPAATTPGFVPCSLHAFSNALYFPQVNVASISASSRIDWANLQQVGRTEFRGARRGQGCKKGCKNPAHWEAHA